MRDDVPSPHLATFPPVDSASIGGDIADAECTRRVAAGDSPALDILYRRHKGLVYRFALLWSGSASTAADITQDVFVHLLTRAADFDASVGALPAWLLGIARNFARRRAGVREEAAPDDDLPSDEPPPDVALSEKRGVESLRRAIATLPPHYRDVLILVELAERSYAEAALICNCELNTVRSRLFRARHLLAQRILGTEAFAENSGAVAAKPADARRK